MKKTNKSTFLTKKRKIEIYIKEILTILGEDVNREGLIKTPHRVAESLIFLTHGYGINIKKVVNNAFFITSISEMIIVKDIELYSLCEHHLLPFIGKCHIAYIPNEKIIGLSKIARIVDIFSRRLQTQEHLTQQIAECILKTTNATGVGVIIEAKHLCMMMRGVEKQNSIMTTSVMLGCLKSQSSTRTEFLTLVKSS